jgi:hypothetical protein
MEMSMSKFKVGDKVRCVKAGLRYITEGCIYEIDTVNGKFYHVITDCGLRNSYYWNVFELVEPNLVLTPEEVFEHLRKGTKLQLQNSHSGKWYNVVAPEYVSYVEITTKQWRVKPEPEVIELNGKRYKLIEE